MGMKRYCLIEFTRKTPDEVAAFLPSNYKIEAVVDGQIVIGGRDDHGWTMHGYVLPRLGSGMIGAKEIDLSHPIMKLIPMEN